MNKQELLDKINELTNKQNEIQAEIAELKLQTEKVGDKPNPRWVPKNNEEYYCITGYSEVKHSNWGNHSFDKGRLSIGNVFRTKEEAEFALERLKVIAELREYSREFVVDSGNHYFDCDHNTKKIGYNLTRFYRNNNLYFPSKEIAQQAVEAVGEDRVKKYYLGMK